jgi:hypothetical protein
MLFRRVFVRWGIPRRIQWHAEKPAWVVKDEEGNVLREGVTPKQFDPEAIRSLTITYIKPSRQRRHIPMPD